MHVSAKEGCHNNSLNEHQYNKVQTKQKKEERDGGENVEFMTAEYAVLPRRQTEDIIKGSLCSGM